MKSRSVIFVVMSFLVVALIYSSFTSNTFKASAAGPITCNRTGTVTITCCQDEVINRSPANPAGTLVTYCTDCEVGPIYGEDVPENCGERYIEMGLEQPPITPPPAAVARLQEGVDPGEATTLPEVPVLEAQRANITILPGGILQTENNTTFSKMNLSSNDRNNIIAMEQSDLVSDAEENTTSAADEEDTGTSDEDGNVEEELPPEE